MTTVITDAFLPTRIEQGMQIVPGFDTSVLYGTSGNCFRNARRVRGRRRYRLGFGEWNWTDDELLGVYTLAMAMRGRLYAFPMTDPFDYQAVNELTAPVPGDTTQRQLAKNYTRGSATYQRPIFLPDAGSVTSSPSGTLLSNGILQYGGTAPAATASFTFKVPVCFTSDDPAVIINGLTGNVPSLEVEEVLL